MSIPAFISRTAWGAVEERGQVLSGRQPLVVVHHAYRPDVPGDADARVELAAVRGIQAYHVETKEWPAIAYNWLVFQSGRSYEGRGWFRQGTHAKGANNRSVGVCFVIDGQRRSASAAAIASARELLRWGVLMGALREDYQVTGHRDVTPARTCPGDKLAAQMPELAAKVVLRPAPPAPSLAAPMHPIARAILDGRWDAQLRVSVTQLLAAMDLLETVGLEPRVAKTPGAQELLRIVTGVRQHYPLRS